MALGGKAPGKALGAILIGAALGTGCGGGSSDRAATDTPRNAALVAERLAPGAADALAYGPGTTPVSEGSWLRFPPSTSWAWQLKGPINLDYEADLYVVDLFDRIADDTVERLHAAGRSVLCYFSAGTHEPWRADAHLFDGVPLGNPHTLYPDERWLDIRSPEVIRLMINRMEIAKRLGCDGVELDNVDAFLYDDSGLGISVAEQTRYSRILANAAHERNLAVALKNSLTMIDELAPWFDLAINEECFEFDECALYEPMLAAGKPVLNAEYLPRWRDDPVARERLCVDARALGLRTLVLPIELDGSFRLSCDAG